MTTQHTPPLPTDTQWITEAIRKAELFDTATTAGVMVAVASHADLLAALREIEADAAVNGARYPDAVVARVLAGARAAIAKVEGNT